MQAAFSGKGTMQECLEKAPEIPQERPGGSGRVKAIGVSRKSFVGVSERYFLYPGRYTRHAPIRPVARGYFLLRQEKAGEKVEVGGGSGALQEWGGVASQAGSNAGV